LSRAMVKTFAEALMGPGGGRDLRAAYRSRDEGRTNRRNGYRARSWDTRVGSVEVDIPKLRAGGYFPDCLPTPAS
jgi:putative transposase